MQIAQKSQIPPIALVDGRLKQKERGTEVPLIHKVVTKVDTGGITDI